MPETGACGRGGSYLEGRPAAFGLRRGFEPGKRWGKGLCSCPAGAGKAGALPRCIAAGSGSSGVPHGWVAFLLFEVEERAGSTCRRASRDGMFNKWRTLFAMRISRRASLRAGKMAGRRPRSGLAGAARRICRACGSAGEWCAIQGSNL